MYMTDFMLIFFTTNNQELRRLILFTIKNETSRTRKRSAEQSKEKGSQDVEKGRGRDVQENGKSEVRWRKSRREAVRGGDSGRRERSCGKVTDRQG